MGFVGQLALALALNIGLKVFTFVLSTILTRLLLPQQSGISFSYAVYVDSVLFIAREAVRNTASRLAIRESVESDRAPDGKRERAASGMAVRRVANLGSLSVPIACAVMLALELQNALQMPLLPSLYHTALSASFSDSAGRGHEHDGAQTPLHWARPVGPVKLLASADGAVQRHLPAAIARLFPEVLVCVSILLSASVEPCLLVAQSLDLYRVVVLAEFVSLLFRLATTIGLVRLMMTSSGETQGAALATPYETRLVFAVGQLVYAVAHASYSMLVCSKVVGGHSTLAALTRRTLGGSEALSAACRAAAELDKSKDGKEATPRTPHSCQPLLPFPFNVFTLRGVCSAATAQFALLRSFFAESVLRLALSEGEGFALSSVGSERARGHYQLVSNLGSLVARLIFRVWENACFVRWSRDVAGGGYASAVALLVLMLRVSFCFGYAFVLLGPPFAEVLLRSLYSTRWSTPGIVRALQVYCYALPCMAWNGLLEAFLRAVATPQTLQQQQRFMLAQSLFYVAVCYVGLKATASTGWNVEDDGGPVCFLIGANIVSTLMRMSYTIWTLTRLRKPQTAAKVAAEKCTADADGAPILSIAALREATPLNNAALVLVVAALTVATRAVTPSFVKLIAFAAVYMFAVLALDAGMRAMAQRVAVAVLAKIHRTDVSNVRQPTTSSLSSPPPPPVGQKEAVASALR